MSVPLPLARRAVLITGGAGFIGSRTAGLLAEAGARVVVADDLSTGDAARLGGGRSEGRLGLHPVDVSAPGSVSGLMGEEGPFDVVLHLAARVGVRRVLEDPEGCWREHLGMGRELLASIAGLPEGRRPRVYSASTSEVYRDRAGRLGEDAPLRPLGGRGRWAYACSKLAVERLLDAASDLWAVGRGPVHLRFFNVVGPGQDTGSGMVLPTFIGQALAGGPLTVHGDGSQRRTFAHVDDVAADLVRLISLGDAPPGPLNLGGSARCTIAELAQAVCRAAGLGKGLLRSVDPRRTVNAHFEGVHEREPELSYARSLGLARAERNLDSIIEHTLAWHRGSNAGA
jgi:nucleoside-diphosphate-sugar epimerase